MSAPSILLIGAGGYLGGPVTQELLANRSRFNRIAILTQESKKEKFTEHEAKGFELVLGAFDSPDSFKGFARGLSLRYELTELRVRYCDLHAWKSCHEMPACHY
jgi:uncharacterized protein YbjT (DUF2867 family)